MHFVRSRLAALIFTLLLFAAYADGVVIGREEAVEKRSVSYFSKCVAVALLASCIYLLMASVASAESNGSSVANRYVIDTSPGISSYVQQRPFRPQQEINEAAIIVDSSGDLSGDASDEIDRERREKKTI